LKCLNQAHGENWSLYQGDCCDVTKGLPDNSVHYSIFSPPFESLYTYSNSERDLGNNRANGEFYTHLKFIVTELFRIIKPGRLLSFHCMDIPAMKSRDGFIGLKDFPGDLLRLFQSVGFIYHSKVAIWKDPLTEVTRTKAIGLMHKQLVKDSALSRQGLPDYLITMRKPGVNEEPITHPGGLDSYAGESEPDAPRGERPDPDPDKFVKHEAYTGGPIYSHQAWRKYASPVWMDIRQTHTLQYRSARAEDDERHICPLQLDVIERGITLWSNPGEIIFTPFAGIGSECYQSVKMGRKAVGVELKESYFNSAATNLKNLSAEMDVELDDLLS